MPTATRICQNSFSRPVVDSHPMILLISITTCCVLIVKKFVVFVGISRHCFRFGFVCFRCTVKTLKIITFQMTCSVFGHDACVRAFVCLYFFMFLPCIRSASACVFAPAANWIYPHVYEMVTMRIEVNPAVDCQNRQQPWNETERRRIFRILTCIYIHTFQPNHVLNTESNRSTTKTALHIQQIHFCTTCVAHNKFTNQCSFAKKSR